MLRRTLFIIVFSLVFSSAAWSLTPHGDYAGMDIKDCNACHQGNEVAANHGSFWLDEHRLYAEKQPSNCNDCHQQSFCLDCHIGGGIDRDLHVSTSGVDYMPKSHRTDFRELHPIKALDDPRSCSRCHDARGFCEECHSKFNRADLRVLSHRRGFSELEVKAGGPQHEVFTPGQCQTCHPQSLLPKHQWSASHAREARRNLFTCQTCHPGGNVCLKCHSAREGLMVNPHPRDWGDISGKLSDASDRRTCIRCH